MNCNTLYWTHVKYSSSLSCRQPFNLLLLPVLI
nr:MAG TPA: hypothetical protein [Caudoviricetes sp.]